MRHFLVLIFITISTSIFANVTIWGESGFNMLTPMYPMSINAIKDTSSYGIAIEFNNIAISYSQGITTLVNNNQRSVNQPPIGQFSYVNGTYIPSYNGIDALFFLPIDNNFSLIGGMGLYYITNITVGQNLLTWDTWKYNQLSYISPEASIGISIKYSLVNVAIIYHTIKGVTGMVGITF